MAAATALEQWTPEEIAQALRATAERIERGDKLSPALDEIVMQLLTAEEAEDDAEVVQLMEDIADRHAKILEALAK